MGNRGTLWQNKLRSGLLTDITFDQAQTQYLETVENLSINSTGMTVSMFMELTDFTVNHFFEFGLFSLWFDASGLLRASIRTVSDTTTNQLFTSVDDYFYGKTHLLVTWNENTSGVTAYVNSVNRGTITFPVSGIKIEENDIVSIGRRITTYFSGNMSNVMIFDKVLDQGEISYIYNTGQIHSTMRENIVAHYPLNEAFAFVADSDFVAKYTGFSTNDLVLFDVVSNYNRGKSTPVSNKHLKAFNFDNQDLVQSLVIKDFYNKLNPNNKLWTQYFTRDSGRNLLIQTGTSNYIDADSDFTIILHFSSVFDDIDLFNFSGDGSSLILFDNGTNSISITHRAINSFRFSILNDTESDYLNITHPTDTLFMPQTSAIKGRDLFYTMRYSSSAQTIYCNYDIPSLNHNDDFTYTGVTATPDLSANTNIEMYRFHQIHRVVTTKSFVSDEDLNLLIRNENVTLTNVTSDFRPDITTNTMLDIVSGNTLQFENQDFGFTSASTENSFVWYNDTRLGGFRPFLRDSLTLSSSAHTINTIVGSAITSNEITVLLICKFEDDVVYSGATLNTFLGWDNGSEVTRLYSKSDGGIYVSNASEVELIGSGDSKNRIISLALTNELTTTGSSVNNIYENGVLISTSSNSTIDNFSASTLQIKGYEGENFHVIAFGVYDGILTRDEIIKFSSYSNPIAPNLYRDTNWLAYLPFSKNYIYYSITDNYITNLASRSQINVTNQGLNSVLNWDQNDNIGTIRSFSNNQMFLNTTGETGTTIVRGDAFNSIGVSQPMTTMVDISSFVSGSSGGTIIFGYGLSGESTTITGAGTYRIDGTYSDPTYSGLAPIHFRIDPDVQATVNAIRSYLNFNDFQIQGFSGATIQDQFNTIDANIKNLNRLR